MKFRETHDPAAFRNWFLDGMECHGSDLQDPPRMAWDETYRQDRPDAMFLMACNELGTLETGVATAIAEAEAFAEILGQEWGKTLRRNRVAIEHFGYADGISQPRFFVNEPDHESLDVVLLPDPLADGPDAYGSYLVYRKLEQNVKGFRKAEEDLADLLDLQGASRDRAAAMIVGRFRDGRPLTTPAFASIVDSGDNSFSFRDDPSGQWCPVHSHIRKVRPRLNEARRPRIVRRGVPYGTDLHDPENPPDPLPETGVGMLFLSFQSDIRRQFGAVQQMWANNRDFPRGNTGRDPIIGQGPGATSQQWPPKLGWSSLPQGRVTLEAS